MLNRYLFIALLAACLSCSCFGHAGPAVIGHEKGTAGAIVLSFAGDCTFGTVNEDDSSIRFPKIYAAAHQIDYPFALVRPWFVRDDLTTVNFECTLTTAAKPASKQWKFKGPASYATIFPAGSVEAVGLANNHSFDYLKQGFDDTAANFKKGHVSAFYQNTPLITTIKGVQVVLLGDCTVVGENTTVIDGTPARVLAEIARYKKPDNLVIVVMHWGSELDTVPITWQQAMGHQFIDAGADAVVGAHPHVLQGIEQYKGKYIAYSLGNFAFGGNSLARHPETMILRLTFPLFDGQPGKAMLAVVPCLTTSSTQKNKDGVLLNNYQPIPLSGAAAKKVTGLVLSRSASLKFGIKKLDIAHEL
jgi:poly-gamma-glutamate synthesis protein (capsule biosynthesis protein)